MGPRQLRKHCKLDDAGERLLKQALTELGLSARAHDKILRVARTIADLAGEEHIQPDARQRGDHVPPAGSKAVRLAPTTCWVMWVTRAYV